MALVAARRGSHARHALSPLLPRRRGERGELLEGRGEPLDRLDADAEGGREAVHREAGCEVLQARGVLTGAGEVPGPKGARGRERARERVEGGRHQHILDGDPGLVVAPELVVVDTCFGASSELLAALGDLDAVIVAAASLLPSAGFVYGAEFFAADDPMARAAAVQTQPETELLRWRNDPAALAGLLERVDAMGPDELGAHLARRRPPTVKVALPGGGPVLVPIAWEGLGPIRPRPRTRPIR
jgi:hypothetical protein